MEVRKKQCLLKYLGYYDGQVDGIWGAGSAQATRDLQAASGLNPDGIFGDGTLAAAKEAVANDRFKTQDKPERPQTPPADGDDFWLSVPNFTRPEFACKCGCGFDDISHTLVQVIQRVRDHFDSPVVVSSGCRCLPHNARVGGVKNSRHTIGHAVDFAARGHSAQEVLAYVQQQPEIKYSYAIDSNYVHMDIGA